MRHSLRTGICFGLTSASITTLGLMVGLYSGTSSLMVVLGGILLVAVADALSDSLGIHIAEESKRNSRKHIWEATLSALFSKFLLALTFLPALFLFELHRAIVVNVFWGLLVLAVLSFFIAKDQKESAPKVIAEHVVIASVVILLSNWIGICINKFFG